MLLSLPSPAETSLFLTSPPPPPIPFVYVSLHRIMVAYASMVGGYVLDQVPFTRLRSMTHALLP